jgi:hypothetical protein
MSQDDMLSCPEAGGGGTQVNPGLRNLITLQDIDQKISALRKQISETPKKIQAYQDELKQASEVYQNHLARIQELAKQRRTREGDVELMRTKLSRLKDQLMAVKTNKEYTAMLHEIQAADDQIRSAEDGILEIMEQAESMEGALEEEARIFKSRESELAEQIRATEKAAPIIEQETAKLVDEKTALERHISIDLLERYRRIADARKGIALAEAKEELCSACHVRIRPQVFADLLRTEEIHVCDSCSRILFLRS